jgi:hypothetical protein
MNNEKFEEQHMQYDSQYGLWGHAVTYTRVDKMGKMWIGNGEYENQVNYCPYTGIAAPVQMKLTKVINNRTYYEDLTKQNENDNKDI